MKNESRISVRTLTAMALLIAMSIVFSRVLSISTGFVRFNLGSLPVLLAGILFGPWAGFVVGMVADIIGGVLAGYAINPLITLGAASIGLVGGLGWQRLSHLRTGNRLRCSVLAAHFVGSMVINSLALHIFYGYAWAVLIARIPNALVRSGEYGAAAYSARESGADGSGEKVRALLRRAKFSFAHQKRTRNGSRACARGRALLR